MNIQYLKKILNYKLIEYQKKKKTSFVFGYPYWLTIDPSNICNLRCVFCPTGQRRGTRSPAILPFDKYKKIINKFGPYLFHIDFCNWGEPLLNKEIYKMIAYAKKYGPTTKIDSSFNVELKENDAEELVKSGLDRINISLDGASQATYEIYRRDGNFNKVVDNMKLLVKKKKELKSLTPVIHWQFLVFKHNENEIEKARMMAKEIGVDSIGFTAPFCGPEWVSNIEEYNNYIVRDDKVDFKKQNPMCEWLWDAITINADGSVSPCCSVEDQKDDFGNFFSIPFIFLWNNNSFRKARKFVRDGIKPKKENVCTRCDHIGASNHTKVNINTIKG